MLRGGNVAAAHHAAAAISRADARAAGRVALVGAGPGDPDLLTIRARELLADADFVLHDALVSAETLALRGPDTRLENVGKRGGRASVPQSETTARMIELARLGHFVVRLKGGDPFVFGRGGEELRDLVAAGVDMVVVPGVSAAIAAPAAAGISLTMRGVASSLAVTAGEGDAPPARPRQPAAPPRPPLALLAQGKLKAIIATLVDVLGQARPAALICSATLPEQEVVTGTLADIAEEALRAGLRPPATLIVGEVVAHAAANHQQVVALASLG